MSVVAVLAKPSAVWTFVVQSLRYRRSEVAWFAAWPGACLTGRFARHEGHFDPGQRVANLLMAGSLILLIASGIGLLLVQGGPEFVWLLRIHRWATYVLTPVIAGHVVVTAGVLPGYRGVWRAMHRQGRISVTLAHRLWPAWTESALAKNAWRNEDARQAPIDRVPLDDR